MHCLMSADVRSTLIRLLKFLMCAAGHYRKKEKFGESISTLPSSSEISCSR